MIFVGNAIGWDISNINFMLTSLASLVILFYGSGCWSDDPNCCRDGVCAVDTKIAAMGGAMVGAGTNMMETVKEKMDNMENRDGLQAVKEKASDMIDTAKDHLDSVVDTTKNWGDKAKDMATKVVDAVPSMDTVTDKVEVVVDFIQDKADTVVDFTQDKIADAKEMVTDASENIAKKVDAVVGEQEQDKA